MAVQQLRQRVARLEQRQGVDQKIVIKGVLFGQPEWRDVDGFGMCFVGTWTIEVKAEVLGGSVVFFTPAAAGGGCHRGP